MYCPTCGGKTKVTDTATHKGLVARRRVCKDCGRVVHTLELCDKHDTSMKILSARQKAWVNSKRLRELMQTERSGQRCG